MQNENAVFWMVWSPSAGAPSKKHVTEADAKGEAERLSRQNNGKEFFILRAISVTKAIVPPVETVNLELKESANVDA